MRDNQTQIQGDNNVVGNGNQVINNNTNNVTNNNGGGNGGGKGDDNEGLKILAAFATALALTLWLFAKHAPLIYTCIKLGAFLAIFLFVIHLSIKGIKGEINFDTAFTFISGIGISVGILFLASYGEAKLDPQLIELSRKMDYISFYKSLSDYGKQMLIENTLGTLAVILSLLINLGFGLHQILRAFFGSKAILSTFSRGKSLVVAIPLLLVSFGLYSDFLLSLMDKSKVTL